MQQVHTYELITVGNSSNIPANIRNISKNSKKAKKVSSEVSEGQTDVQKNNESGKLKSIVRTGKHSNNMNKTIGTGSGTNEVEADKKQIV